MKYNVVYVRIKTEYFREESIILLCLSSLKGIAGSRLLAMVYSQWQFISNRINNRYNEYLILLL